MPNRILKESICYSDDIDKLSPFAETVFYRLMVRCDDYGRIDARPCFLKSTLFVTKRGISEKSVEDAIEQLKSAGLVTEYTVNGKPFVYFPKWNLHQRIRNSREKYPSPENCDKNALAASCGELRQDAARARAESNPNPIRIQSNTESESESAAEPLELAMNAFREMRKKIKAPMTDKAERMILIELQKLAPNDKEKQVAILNQSTMKGWRGVFPLKDAPQQPDRFANLKRMYEEAEG